MIEFLFRVTCSSLEWKVQISSWSNRGGIYLKEAVLPRRSDAEMGPANSLHALAKYSEYNERFDFDLRFDLTQTRKSAFVYVCSGHLNVIVITFYSSSCLGQETAKGAFGLRVKLPPANLFTL